MLPAYLRSSSTGRKPRNGRGWRGVEKKTRRKVRWKRMYVEHVAAGIASMCHRGNHAGNAEAHLTALPSCIYLPPSYSVYIYCLRASTNRVSSRSRSPFRSVFLCFSQHALARKFAKYETCRSSQNLINGHNVYKALEIYTIPFSSNKNQNIKQYFCNIFFFIN